MNFRAERGEIVGVLGPNGAGKSTLLRVMSGALAPLAGGARLFGKAIAAYDRRDFAKLVAVVPQTQAIAFGYRVRDVVMMGRAPHQGGWMRPSDEDVRLVDALLTRCDLRALADRPADALSGGEQKRVAIARALAQRPKVLLLDEPAAFLDVRHQIGLHDLLADTVRGEGIACVVAMHDLNAAAQYADRVVLLKTGRIVASGTPGDVLTKERVAETFEAPVHVGRLEGSDAPYFVVLRGAGDRERAGEGVRTFR